MRNLATTVVDLLFELTFVTEDYVNFEWGVSRCSEILSQIENDYSDEERAAVRAAAAAKLQDLLREPDEYGYTPRDLVTPEQRSFLEVVAAGRFDGSPEE